MKDIGRLMKRFREFGGIRLLQAYHKMGVLNLGLKSIWNCIKTNQSLKNAYPVVTQKLDDVLIDREKHILNEAICSRNKNSLDEWIPHIIWSCWLQGEEDLPEMV
jgi:hypothetical protein